MTESQRCRRSEGRGIKWKEKGQKWMRSKKCEVREDKWIVRKKCKDGGKWNRDGAKDGSQEVGLESFEPQEQN